MYDAKGRSNTTGKLAAAQVSPEPDPNFDRGPGTTLPSRWNPVRRTHQAYPYVLFCKAGRGRRFSPRVLSPRPPLVSKRVNNATHQLGYSAAAMDNSERRVLGGIRYKNVDVTAVINGLGPAVGISAKSTGNAFRNLTNRMEEALEAIS